MSFSHDSLTRSSQSPDQPSQAGFNMDVLFSAILQRRRLFIGLFFGCLALFCTAILLMSKKYEAEMKFLVKNERQDLVISQESNIGPPRPTEPTELDVNSEIELLRSNDVLRKVVIKSGLIVPDPEAVQAAGEISPLSLEKAVARLAKDLDIKAVKKSDIIDITYTSKDPALSSRVLENLEDTYLQAHLKVHGTPGSYAFFEQQANSYGQKLKASQDRLKAFQEAFSSLVGPDQGEALATQSMESQASLEQIDAQIADYEHRISQDQSVLAKLDARIVTEVRTMPQAQLIGNLNQTLIDLRNKQTEAVGRFRADDRRVVELNKQVDDTTAALHNALEEVSTEKQTNANPVSQEVEKDLVTNKITLSGLQARRAVVAGTVTTYQDKAFRLAGANIQHDQLISEVKENQDNYLLYQKKREEARIAESLDQERITNVAVVQAPFTPVRPSSPKIPLLILLSLIAAALIACTTVVRLERNSSNLAVATENPQSFQAAAV